MWLPKPVYKSLPIMYAVMGVLFIAGAVYLDLRDPMGPVYLALGIVSILASITVAYWRAKFPGGKQKVKSDTSESD
jgi:hypothetical protein